MSTKVRLSRSRLKIREVEIFFTLGGISSVKVFVCFALGTKNFAAGGAAVSVCHQGIGMRLVWGAAILNFFTARKIADRNLAE